MCIFYGVHILFILYSWLIHLIQCKVCVHITLQHTLFMVCAYVFMFIMCTYLYHFIYLAYYVHRLLSTYGRGSALWAAHS